MRFLKPLFYIIAVLCLQTVVWPRLGVKSDLVLVSVIIYAVHFTYNRALLFTFIISFTQDLLGFGGYFNTIYKLAVCVLINLIRHNFEGEEQKLIFILVAALSPLSLLIEANFVFQEFYWLSIIWQTIVITIFNLLSVFMLLPLIGRLRDE